MNLFKKYMPAVFVLCLGSGISFAQNKPVIYDRSDKHYAGINFDTIDPLENWNYRLVVSSVPFPEAPAQLGQFLLSRNKPFVDKSMKENGGRWAPFIIFEIYGVRDYDACLAQSNAVRAGASCRPGAVPGGDIFRLGPFVFLNQGDCPACMKGDTKVDYCRPVVEAVFSRVAVWEGMTLKDVVKQLPLREAAQ